MVDAATSTSYLPPPPGQSEPVGRERWDLALLWLLALPALAAVLALGAAGMIRRRETSWQAPALAVLAGVLATLGTLLAVWV